MANNPVRVKTIERDLGYTKILKETKYLDDKAAAVGFLQGADYQDGTPIAHIAAIQEFGSTKKNIPERPFFRNWLSKGKRAINAIVETLIGQILDGNLTVDKGLKTLGIYGVGELKKSIIDLRNPANAPATIARKGSSNPLIDTGTMLNNVDSEIRKIK